MVLTQIWIKLPGRLSQESIQAKYLKESHYEIAEIPFIAKNINYQDVVRCEDVRDTPRLVVEVVIPSGNKTKQIRFGSNIDKNVIRDCILKLKTFGCTYRRSGLLAFSINVPPSVNITELNDYLKDLRSSKILVKTKRKEIGAVDSRREIYII